MAERAETTDKEREKYIIKEMDEMKRRYENVNAKLLNLETRMDTMSRDQAENSSAIQSELNALLRNSIAPKTVSDKTERQPYTSGGLLWKLNARKMNLHHCLRSITA